jgi:hypothetical protein
MARKVGLRFGLSPFRWVRQTAAHTHMIGLNCLFEADLKKMITTNHYHHPRVHREPKPPPWRDRKDTQHPLYLLRIILALPLLSWMLFPGQAPSTRPFRHASPPTHPSTLSFALSPLLADHDKKNTADLPHSSVSIPPTPPRPLPTTPPLYLPQLHPPPPHQTSPSSTYLLQTHTIPIHTTPPPLLTNKPLSQPLVRTHPPSSFSKFLAPTSTPPLE